jgi:hypothetical protein
LVRFVRIQHPTGITELLHHHKVSGFEATLLQVASCCTPFSRDDSERDLLFLSFINFFTKKVRSSSTLVHSPSS